jgi:hypothetical protein
MAFPTLAIRSASCHAPAALIDGMPDHITRNNGHRELPYSNDETAARPNPRAADHATT